MLPHPKILLLFTRTPLHVGAGGSVGAIDQPVVRERHTDFPFVPATALKGSFADQWPADRVDTKGRAARVGTKTENGKAVQGAADVAWLFGSDQAENPWAGALQFSDARLLAFPVRSARGCFAWISCPLILRRALRDGVLRSQNGAAFQIVANALDAFKAANGDETALCTQTSPIALPPRQGQTQHKIVLEEYTFTQGEPPLGLNDAFARLMDDGVWLEVSSRLVILSDGMMSFFARHACEIAQHVKISDETGTAEGGALFNQENVPSETLFYANLNCFPGRGEFGVKQAKDGQPAKLGKTSEEAAKEFTDKVDGKVFQFGGNATTGLGFCSVRLYPPEPPSQGAMQPAATGGGQ